MPEYPIDSDLAEKVVEKFVESLIQNGTISARGKTRDEVYAEAMPFLRDFVKDEVTALSVTIDYRDSLLGLARETNSREEYGTGGVACLLYATWFEHSLNLVLAANFTRDRDLSVEEVKQILRRGSLDDKLTWLLKVAGLPALDDVHVRALRNLNDVRNTYVHYKWQPFVISEGDTSADPLVVDAKAVLEHIEETVSYVQAYERLYVLEGLPEE
jgi:hypothetical protein